jgi:hypothetical protein
VPYGIYYTKHESKAKFDLSWYKPFGLSFDEGFAQCAIIKLTQTWPINVLHGGACNSKMINNCEKPLQKLGVDIR